MQAVQQAFSDDNMQKVLAASFISRAARVFTDAVHALQPGQVACCIIQLVDDVHVLNPCQHTRLAGYQGRKWHQQHQQTSTPNGTLFYVIQNQIKGFSRYPCSNPFRP